MDRPMKENMKEINDINEIHNVLFDSLCYEAVSPSMRDFILKMCRDGKIIVTEELRELNRELKYQGNNLNQLTRLAHQNRFSSADLSELLSVYRKILAALGGQNYGGR